MHKALLHLKSSLRLLVLSIVLGSEETTCTARVSKSYVYGEITDHALSHKLLQVITDHALFLPSGIYDHLRHIIQRPRLSKLM